MTHQQDKLRVADERDGCLQLALGTATVVLGEHVAVRCQAEVSQQPLGGLETKQWAVLYNFWEHRWTGVRPNAVTCTAAATLSGVMSRCLPYVPRARWRCP